MNRRNFIRLASAGLADRALVCQDIPTLSVDQHGLIVQTDGNGGDTAQREGWAWFGSWIREEKLHNPWAVKRTITFQQTMGFLELDQSGTFRRHPDQYNEPQDFSRDQTIPIVAAMGVKGDTERLNRFWAKTVARHYTTQNGEMLRPDGVNLFKRARGVQPGVIGDIQLYPGVKSRIAQAVDPNDVGDDLNLLIILLMAKFKAPATHTGVPGANTEELISMYATERPLSYGSYLQSYRRQYGIDMGAPDTLVLQRMEGGIAKGKGWKPDSDCPPVLGALRWYFRAESKGNPELAELYAPIVRKWCSPVASRRPPKPI